MLKQHNADVTKDVIESGRMAARHLISTGHAGARHVLGACDQAWRTGTNTLAYNPGLITEKLRDDLISIQGQLTLIARYFANNAADCSERAVNDIASAAHSTIGKYERVFDLRVVQAMTRSGEPIAEVLRTLAALVANLSQQLAGLVAVGEAPIAATKAPRGKSTSTMTRKPARRTKQKRG